MTREEQNRVIARAVVMSAIGVAVVFALYLLSEVLLTIYIAGLLAVGLSPIVRRLERGRLLNGRIRLPRWVAILSLYVTFLLTVAFILALVVPPIVAQVRGLIQDLPKYADRLQAFLISQPDRSVLVLEQRFRIFRCPLWPSPDCSALTVFGLLARSLRC